MFLPCLLLGVSVPCGDPALIPWPRSVRLESGELRLNARSRIAVAEESLASLAEILSREILLAAGLQLAVAREPSRPGDVELRLDPALAEEAYVLAARDRVSIAGGSPAAVAMGTSTFLQALRTGDAVTLSRMVIEDSPRLAYRGTMLDVARKPYSIDTLRACVEVCRLNKIRHLHLHLSDENAWTFPSTAFPRLGSKNFAWAGGEKPAVYRLDELKALVAYADVRGVTLVPEMETPGHSGQLRGTLPEIFGYKDASGKTITPGVINMVSERSFAALETLVTEISALFRSAPYIHVGCDEASVEEVESLPDVTAFKKEHGLKDVHAVFNAFIHRMHAIVKRSGKRMIVWEGAPLDPVEPPADVIFMAWVGSSGAAADFVKRGHAVINAPWGTKQAYFDPYEVNGARLARGEPLLLGATSLLWEQPEEAALPFLRQTGALRNEPAHDPDAKRGHADFLRRLQATDRLVDRILHGFTFRAEGALDPLVAMRLDSLFDESVTLELDLPGDPRGVRFTLDGSEPGRDSTPWSGPIRIRDTTTVKARLFSADGTEAGRTLVREYRKVPRLRHDAVGARVTVRPDNPGYPGPGPAGLADGLLADGDESRSAGWVGWEGGSGKVEVTEELREPVKVHRIGAHFLRAMGGIALPARVEFLVSSDGISFRSVAVVAQESCKKARGWCRAEVEGVEARYVRTIVTPSGDWVFLDEVAVNPASIAPGFPHAAMGRPVVLESSPSPSYDAPGAAGLADGHVSRSPDFLGLDWIGIEGKDFDATVDLGSRLELRDVGAHFLQHVGGGVHIPRIVEILVSDDGKEFRKVATIDAPPSDVAACLKTLSCELRETAARYVRVVARTNGQWIFADEVFVNRAAREAQR